MLVPLRQSMAVALEAVMVARRHPSVAVQLQAAREEYLATIVAFEQALTVLGLPVPPRLRDEGRLMRRLLPATSFRRVG
jgi:hypothetical protein